MAALVKWLTHLAVNQTFVSSILISRPIKKASLRYISLYRSFFCFYYSSILTICLNQRTLIYWIFANHIILTIFDAFGLTITRLQELLNDYL